MFRFTLRFHKPQTKARLASGHAFLSRLPEWKTDQWQARTDPTVWPPTTETSFQPASPRHQIPPATLAKYERDGYLLLPSLFSPTEADRLLREALDLRSTSESLASSATGPEGGGGDTMKVITEPNSTAIRSIFEPHKRAGSVFRDLPRDERLLTIVQQILGSDVYNHQSRLNFQPAFRGTGFGWHSDFETWHIEDGMPRPRCLSASILLTDNHATNGPLMVVPGSHRHYVGCVGATPSRAWETSLKNHLTFGTPSEESIREMVVDKGLGLEACIAPKGSVILFDCNLLHASNGNRTPFSRVNAFYVFNSVENTLGDHFDGDGRPEYLATRDPQWMGVPLAPTKLAIGNEGA